MKTSRRNLFVQGALAALALAASTFPAAGQVADKKSLTLDGARKAIAGAQAEARRLNAPGGVIAVVDEGGNLMALERLDGTFAAGARISIGKARTAVLFKKPTKVFEDIVKNGRTAMVALDDFTPLQGGIPILADGQVVGGIGVSGAASAQQDEELAIAGAGAVGAGAAPVTYLGRERVSAAFAQGEPLLETSDYKIHASRRDKAGQAEVHTHETDIIYVTSGSATFVTGGAVVDGKATAPGEIRGTSIAGGESRPLRTGDVVVVPAGVPHWFQTIPAPMTYYVVKSVR